MPTRNLGKTGFKVGIFSLGGQSAIEQPNNFNVAVPLIERALDLGVNFIDTAPRYGLPERWSEQYIGRVMQHRRNEVFLATKTRERSRDASLKMIEESLRLLKTDDLDLWLLHNIGIPEEVNAVFAKGGAMEALIEMHDQKVVRCLGVAAHYHPEPIIDLINREIINRHPFDALILALKRSRRSQPPQLHGAPAPAHCGKADGHHRHEDRGARAYSLQLDSATRRGAAALLWKV
jgi:aryl-alcohol dehydrogenase-like predicted oxidoreductase